MNGIKYYRILNHMSREKLSNLSGVSLSTIKKMECATDFSRMCAYSYRKVSEVLKISVSELIRTDLTDKKAGGPKRASRQSQIDNKNNCIAVYRYKNAFSYDRLANFMCLNSRQQAQAICHREVPLPKHVSALAKLVGMTVEDFSNKYSNLKGEKIS